jgi:hypothetical protein
VNYGADLYSLLTFHAVEKKTRDQLETAAQTPGSFAGFMASASGSISQLIETESKVGRLTIAEKANTGKILIPTLGAAARIRQDANYIASV